MKKTLRLWGVILLVTAFLAPTVLWASGLTPLLNKAESQYTKGDVLGAADALRQALVVVYNKSKLKVNRAVLVKGKPAGFGMIQPKGNDKFKANETIIIYVEPVGYHFAKKGNAYNFGVSADFSVTDTSGNILGGKKGFGNWEYTTQGRPLFDFFMTLTYNFTGIKPGKYFVLTTLNDKHGGGSVTIKTPIEIVK
ncbi:MAG: hypothetical protein DSY91_06645 [Deltaproteobacteria bacterium]|nr:MAG: hypothetical protein DSY91_06645 [Deltaproteobacteria bacterium]